MMRSRLARMVGALAALVGPGLAIAQSPEPTPQEVLEGRGLEQKGKYFLLRKEESAVMVQLNKVLPLVDNLDVLFNQWSANEQKKYMVQALNAEMTACQAQAQAVQAQFGNLDLNAVVAKYQKQDLQQNLAALNQYYRQLQIQRDGVLGQIAPPRVQQSHLDKVEKAREVFLRAYDQMTPSVDVLKAAYSAVAQDDKAANALKVLRQAKGVQVKLGPSEAILHAMARVNNAKNVLDPAYFKPAAFNPKKPPRGAKTGRK